MRFRSFSLTSASAALAAVVSAPPHQPVNMNLGKDANGNTCGWRRKRAHVSNYCKSKVKPYTLPDPLVLARQRLSPRPLEGGSLGRTILRTDRCD